MPTLKIATNAALSITPKNGAECHLLCDPRTMRLRETHAPPTLKCALKKLEQIRSLETRHAAFDDVLFTHNLRGPSENV
jgi:hypothetical protein